MLTTNRVSACIVLYQSGPEVIDAVRSVLASTIPVDLHIVDNHSGDSMLKTLRSVAPKATFHPLEHNIGFGAANNVVMQQIRSAYHLIMNPDVTFEPDLLQRMVGYMTEHPDIGILTPRLFFPDGEEQFVPRMDPTLRRMMGGTLERHLPAARAWRDEYTLRNEAAEGPLEVQVASGCFMLIRTHLLFRLKGFDERFFLYMEDCDLSRRARKLSKIVYHPGFQVTHAWHRESAHHGKARKLHLRSAVRYFRKWGWQW